MFLRLLVSSVQVFGSPHAHAAHQRSFKTSLLQEEEIACTKRQSASNTNVSGATRTCSPEASTRAWLLPFREVMDGSGTQNVARQRWELENEVSTVESLGEVESLYRWDAASSQTLQNERPWANDPNYFKNVRISALALLKMTMHAKSGGNLEVMGVMQGKVAGDTFIVLDAFALPVEGTETRVNAQAEAYEYMVDFLSTAQAAGRPENVVGWYHSHPGYGCWLSGIDVSTQMTNQQYQEPFLAVVIDPHRTMAAGKVELGAFRTYPAGYSPPEDAGESKYQTIPLEKIEDFGVHANQYYPLKVSYFKSALDAALVDAVWGRYWASSLSSSPLISTRRLVIDQMTDVGKKLGAALETVHGLGTAKGLVGRFPSQKRSQDENKIALVAQDATGVSQELLKGLSSLVVKELMFRRNCGPGSEHFVGPLPNTNTSNIDDEKDSSDTR